MRKLFELAGQITVNGLEGLKKQLTGLEGQLSQADKAITKFGRQAEKIGMGFTKTITAPIVAMAAGIFVAANRTADYAHNLDKLSTITGLSAKTLQEFQHVSKMTDVSFEGLVGSITKLTKKMAGIVEEGGKPFEAIRKLGVSVNDSAGNIRDMNELFPELIKALQKIENPTLRNQMAMEIFGKSVNDLAPVLALSGDELDRMRKEAHDLGLVMSDEALKSAEDYGIQIVKLKEQFFAFWRDLSGQFIPVIKDIIALFQSRVVPIFTNVADEIKNVVGWFKSLDPETRKIIIGITALVVAIGPFFLLLGKSILILKSLTTTILLVKTAFTALTIAMATNPFVALIAGAALLTTTLIGARMAMIEVQEQTLKRERIDSLAKGIEGLNRQFLNFMRNGASLVEREKAMSGATFDLKELAEELGFTFDKNNGTTFQQLQNLGMIFVKTRDLTAATKEFNALKKEDKKGATTPAMGQTKEEIADAEKLIADYTEESRKLTNSRLDDLQDEVVKRGQAVLAMNMTDEQRQRALTAINEYHALKRSEIIDEEMDKSKKKAQESVNARKEIETDYSRRVMDQTGNRIGVLESEKAEAIRIATEKGASIADITKYYDNEIQKERDKNTNKDLDRYNKYISQTGESVNQVGQIWLKMGQNRIDQNENWYTREKESIEKSSMNNEEKTKKLEELDLQYHNKATTLRREQAKKEKAIAIFEAVINTSTAIVKALPNIVLATFVGILGAIQTGLIASQPLPLAEGGMVKKRPGGMPAIVGEGSEDEAILPIETATDSIANKLYNKIAVAIQPSNKMSDLSETESKREITFQIGTLVSDERGLKELQRRLLPHFFSEMQRTGNLGRL